MTLHGVHALIIILDIQTIISPRACRPIILESSPLVIVTNIATHVIVMVLGAALKTDMVAGNAIASQQLVTARAKVTMPNSATDPDQEHDCDQGPNLKT